MNDDAPATRGELRTMGAELRQEMGDMRAELKQEIADLRTEVRGAIHHVVETFGTRFDQMTVEIHTLRSDMSTMRQDISREMVEMRQELSRELAGHVRAAAEENRQFLAVLDDRYRDLPPRVSVLERELDEHRRDAALHPRRRKK